MLFLSLFSLFLLLCVPGSYQASPAAAAVDAVKRNLDIYFTSGHTGEVLKRIGRSTAEVVRTGIVTGLGLALIVVLLTASALGPFAALLIPVSLAAGIFLTHLVVQNEYRRWQQGIAIGVPLLVDFVPAFLEVEGVTPREALAYSLSFIPGTLKREMEGVIDRIRRTGRVKEAMDGLAAKAENPVVDAVCFRLAAGWDTGIKADIFDDLADQLEAMNELAISRATAAKTGYLALICVLGLAGMLLIYGYPGWQYLMQQMSEAFI